MICCNMVAIYTFIVVQTFAIKPMNKHCPNVHDTQPSEFLFVVLVIVSFTQKFRYIFYFSQFCMITKMLGD